MRNNDRFRQWRVITLLLLAVGHLAAAILEPDDILLKTDSTSNATLEVAPPRPINNTDASQRERRRYASQYPSELNLPFPSRPSFSPGQPPPLTAFENRPPPNEESEIGSTGNIELQPGPIFRGVTLGRSEENQHHQTGRPPTDSPPGVRLISLETDENDYGDVFQANFRRVTPASTPPVYISTVAPSLPVATPVPTLLSLLQRPHPNSSPRYDQQHLSNQAINLPPSSLDGGRPNDGGESPRDAPAAPAVMDMPRITAVLLQCSMTSMKVNLEFDRPFSGVIYSRGFFNDPHCHYVPYGSGPSTTFDFEVAVNRCGARFVEPQQSDEGDRQPQTVAVSALEDELVVQNEPGIQEVWDTARHVRCTWSGTLRRTVQSALRVNVLGTESVSRSADTADARLDVQLGRGPFAEPVTGLVEIGDTLTLVVAVHASGVDDVRVRECVARDGAGRSVPLTDPDGCVLRPKLLSPWHLTRDTGRTGASMLAYSYLQAFKFPDRMEVQLECSLDICKRKCQQTACTGDDVVRNDYRVNRQVVTSRRQRRDSQFMQQQRHQNRSSGDEQLILQKTLRVVSRDELAALRKVADVTHPPDDVPAATPPVKPTPISYLTSKDVCLSLTHFVVCSVTVLSTAVAACVATAVVCIRRMSSRSTSINGDSSRWRNGGYISTLQQPTVKFPPPPSSTKNCSGTWPKIGTSNA